MSLVVDDNTIVRVRALTNAPDFLAIHSAQWGRTPGSTYKPTFVGEFGWMAHVDAAPLDLGVPTTGDQLAICFKHTPAKIDGELALATPFAAAAQRSMRPNTVKTKRKRASDAPRPPKETFPENLSHVPRGAT